MLSKTSIINPLLSPVLKSILLYLSSSRLDPIASTTAHREGASSVKLIFLPYNYPSSDFCLAEMYEAILSDAV